MSEKGPAIEWTVSTRHLLLLAFTAAVFLSAVTRVLGLDIWWHLAVGRYLLQTRSFPSHDVFSFTGGAWDNKEWLFGIIVYLVHRAGGAGLLTLAKAAIFASTFLLLYLVAAKRSGERHLSLAVVLLAAAACRVRLAFRPELLSFLFTALLLLAIEEFREGRRRPLCLFPLLMLAWVNIHPLAFVGLVVLALQIAGGIAARALFGPAERNGWRRPPAKDLALLSLVFAASCLAFCCSPASWRRFLSPVELLTTHSSYLASLTEAAPLPLFQFPAFMEFVLLAAFTLVMFAANMEPADTLCIAVFGAASLTMARNAPLLPVVAAPAIAAQFARFLRAVAPDLEGRVARRRAAVDAAFAAALAAIAVWAVRQPDFGLGYGAIPYPEGAVKYIETARPGGRMFNIYDWGGFLIWRLYPGYRVFIDGRGPDAYPPEVWREYEGVELARDGWQAILDRRGVNLVLVSTGDKLHPLIGALNASPAWRLAYWDTYSMLFLRDTPENRRLIEPPRYAVFDSERVVFRGWAPQVELQVVSELLDYLKAHPDSLEGRNLLAMTYLRRGMAEPAIAEYERVAASRPDVPRIHYNLGMLYSQRGDADRAAAEYEREIAVDGAFPPAYNNLGRIYLERGDLKRAEKCFRKALRIDPNYVHARNNLGLILLERGRAGEALAEFRKALAIDPSYEAGARNLPIAQEMEKNPAETFNRLGQIYYGQNDLDRAARQFERAVEINPRHAIAMGNLGVVQLRRGRAAEAAAQFRKALAISPGDEGLRRNLAVAETMAAGSGPVAPPGVPPAAASGAPSSSEAPR